MTDDLREKASKWPDPEIAGKHGHFELGLRLKIGEERENGDKDWADWAEGLLNGIDCAVESSDREIERIQSATFERAAKLICGAQYGVPCRHSATDYYGCPAAAIWREREKK